MPFNIFIANDPQNQVIFKELCVKLCVKLCEYGVTSIWDECQKNIFDANQVIGNGL